MSQGKSERIVNLTILLLSARSFLSRDRIREVVEGYRNLSDSNFERTFERDKDELRSMGIQIETGSNDHYFDEAEGYRIRRSDFELPAVEFTQAEAAILGLAAQVWKQQSVADSTTRAMTKLRSAGLDPDTSRLNALQPSVNAPEPAFEAVKDALLARRAIRFRYRGGDEWRTVEPWLLPFRNGAWYLIGRDQARNERRCFKLSRITGVPKPTGRAEAFEVPRDVDADVMIRGVQGEGEPQRALLAIRTGHAPTLRRRGVAAETALPLPGDFGAWAVPYVRTAELVAEAARWAPDVAILEPASLQRAYVHHLEALVAAHSSDGSTS